MLTALVMAVGVYIPFSLLAPNIGMVPLPPSYFAWLVVMLLAYVGLTQKVKTWYINKYGFN
jgi:Mg2+-importing ATPase